MKSFIAIGVLASMAIVGLASMAFATPPTSPAFELLPRSLDTFSTEFMMEDGQMRAAAPECRGQLGWVYFKGHCYMFTAYHTPFLKAEEECNRVGSYLADVLTVEENTFIKSVLAVINPKDGTDYWLGGLDADKNKGLQWMTGAPLDFSNFVKDQPNGQPYLHMNFDNQFAWDTKDDANDQDNGFICKRSSAA